ncbi:unnamed protein product [Schistosoma margrebowiei]|uniref:Uncharacterized protein n=1 Tax=Schistosoma margrebowiei TaxID=48269 RepID=A0A183MEX9_9TREM|nr:unnamed protein product [Schistosoma margrebowiei]
MVGGSYQETADIGFVLLETHQQGVHVYWPDTISNNLLCERTNRMPEKEEPVEVNKTHIEESTQLCHKAIPDHLESSRPQKKKKKTKEHILPINLDRYENNEQQFDRSRKECAGQKQIPFQRTSTIKHRISRTGSIGQDNNNNNNNTIGNMIITSGINNSGIQHQQSSIRRPSIMQKYMGEIEFTGLNQTARTCLITMTTYNLNSNIRINKIVVGGSQQETLNSGFALFGTRQQGVPNIMIEPMLHDEFDSVSHSFTIRYFITESLV